MENLAKTCELCDTAGGKVLWETPVCRVVLVGDGDYPGFCRVIWTAHVREMSDLDAGERRFLMEVVFGVEKVIRELFSPHKINLASFGNMTPHLHWHVIPRWADDRHFPEPIWGKTHQESVPRRRSVSDDTLIQVLRQHLPPIDLLEKTP